MEAALAGPVETAEKKWVTFLNEVDQEMEETLSPAETGFEDFESWTSVKPVLEAFAKKHEVQLVLSNENGHSSPVLDEPGKLFIKFWSRPRLDDSYYLNPENILQEDIRDCQAVESVRIFGERVYETKMDTGFRPSRLGLVIKTPEEDLVVAEALRGTLFVLFDVTNDEEGGISAKIIRRILAAYGNILRSPELARKLRESAPRPTRQVVLEEDKNMDGTWPVLKGVLLEYAEKLNTHILVRNPHGKVVPPQTEKGKLFIRFWSAPSPMGDPTKTARLYGLEINDGQWDSRRPAGIGVVLRDEAGNPAAELVGGTLYILFDLPHGGAQNAPVLLKRIMDHLMEIYPRTEEKFQRLLEEQKAREYEVTRRSYVQECQRRIAKGITDYKNAVAISEDEIRKFQRGLADSFRKLQDYLRNLRSLETTEKDLEARFADEFDKLNQVKGVKRVVVEDSGLIRVFTENIRITHKDITRDIGEFRLDIHSHEAEIRVHNLTRVIPRPGVEDEGYFHPHIKSNGICCLGDAAVGITKLLADYEYSILAQVMLQFLKTCSPRGWYISVENWPVAKKEEAETFTEGGIVH